ncbi:MAG: hypothetical protein OEZ43_01680 [Gammaproteobacteria bacterium]|nr:hypothetical protein [Gammaproteobacteria bacterium]
MNKAVIDVVVIVFALVTGGFVSVLDNPLTATFAFLLILGVWEFAKYIPSVLARKRENV